jgi:hypothetical protein
MNEGQCQLDTVYVGLVEWSSMDCDQVPAVFVTTTEYGAWAATMRCILAVNEAAPDGLSWCYRGHFDGGGDWFAENPAPHEGDLAAVREWHRALRDATTAPWVTVEAHCVSPE